MNKTVGLCLLLAAVLAPGLASAQVCGDYARDAGEQCDDGNARNLDGCNSACGLEQTQRVNSLTLVRITDAACAANRFGGAFTLVGAGSTNTGINQAVQAGSTSILFHFRDLDDLAGINDPSLQVGVLSSAPILPGAVAYTGNNDADWWHAVDQTLIDGANNPVNNLTGTLAGNALNATGAAEIKLILGGGPASFSFTNINLNAISGAPTTPASAVGLVPPGHIAVEHLDPTLQSFGTMTGATAGQGTLCGNISALSLSQIVVPPALRVGPGACSQGYTTANSLLDVFIGGCTVGIPAVNVAQPDQTVPATPAPVGTGPFTFTANATTRVVDRCRDSLDVTMDLPTCLAHLAYSSYFRFTTNRVITHDNLLFSDSFGSGDLSAWTAAATDNGDLSVDASASLAGTPAFGLLGDINDTTGIYVEDQVPVDENRVRTRFYIDPSAFDPGEASLQRRTRVLIGFEESPLRRVFAIVLRRVNGQYGLMGRARLDNGDQADTGFFDITAASHFVEIDWLRSSGADANDGRFVLSIDGVVQSTLTGLDNSISSVDFSRLGALSVKASANGSVKWDHYQANRMGAVGP